MNEQVKLFYFLDWLFLILLLWYFMIEFLSLNELKLIDDEINE